MFKKIIRTGVPLLILMLSWSCLGGCDHRTSHKARKAVVVQPAPQVIDQDWLWLALSPGVLLLTLLAGVHIGIKGSRDTRKGGVG